MNKDKKPRAVRERGVPTGYSIPREMMRRLLNHAKRTNLTTTEIQRIALSQYLQQHEPAFAVAV